MSSKANKDRAKKVYKKSVAVASKIGKNVKSISKAKKPSYRTSQYFSNVGVARPSGTKQRIKAGPGRPAGQASYKHRDPQTGQLIPATLYYKRVKQIRREAQQAAQLRDLKAVQELGKRGIPPEQAKQIVDAKQLQSIGVQAQVPQQLTPEQIRRMQMQQEQMQRFQQQAQMNGQVVPQGTRVWKFRRGMVGEEGGLFGRTQKVYGLPQSFWN